MVTFVFVPDVTLHLSSSRLRAITDCPLWAGSEHAWHVEYGDCFAHTATLAATLLLKQREKRQGILQCAVRAFENVSNNVT
jgi:hypothetical protein